MSYPTGSWFACPADLLILMRDKTASKSQDILLMYIGLRTWGTKVKQGEDTGAEVHWAAIAITDFIRELKISERQVVDMIADAIDRGLIRVKKAGQQRLYQLAPENWKTARDYEVKEYAAEDDAAEDDAAEDDAAEDDAISSKVLTTQKLVVKHGTRCRPVPFHVVMKGTTEPVKLRMECEVADPRLPAIEFDATSREGGRFTVSVRCAKGEEIAKNPRAQPQEFNPVSSTKSYRKLLKSQLVNVYNHPYTENFLVDVLKRADGAPFEVYEAKLADRQERARKTREKLDHRVLLWVADDVAALTRQRAEMDLERAAAKAAASKFKTADAERHRKIVFDWCLAEARADVAEYERFLAARHALGETDWPTLEELGVRS